MTTKLNTPKELMARLKIGRTKMYGIFKRREIDTILIGKEIRVTEEAFLKYLNSNMQ